MRYFIILISISFSLNITLADNAELGFTKQKFEAMKEVFNKIQHKSFRDNREYCGYMGVTQSGKIAFTEAFKGRQDSCYVEDLPEDFNIIASFHTHGAFSPDADSEIPSPEDLSADISEGVDGFIATPGGKVWFSDATKKEVRLLCGRNCVKSDPKFDASKLPKVGDYYTLRGLKDFFGDE